MDNDKKKSILKQIFYKWFILKEMKNKIDILDDNAKKIIKKRYEITGADEREQVTDELMQKALYKNIQKDPALKKRLNELTAAQNAAKNKSCVLQ